MDYREIRKKWVSYFNGKDYYYSVPGARFLKSSLERRLESVEGHGSSEELSLMNNLSVMIGLISTSTEFLDSNSLVVSHFLETADNDVVSIRPEFRLSQTNRIISSHPSIDNLSERVRTPFVPRKGYVFYSLDYKQQEPWIAVNLLGDDELIGLFDKDDDFYYALLKEFGFDLTTSNREIMKHIWISSLYGVTFEEIPEYMPFRVVHDWVNSLDSVKDLRKTVKERLKVGKSVYTVFGSQRKFQGRGRSSVRRAFNSIFQMTGADILVRSLENIQEQIDTLGLKDKISIYLPRHDEIIFEVDEDFGNFRFISFLEKVDFNIEGWSSPKFSVSMGVNLGTLL